MREEMKEQREKEKQNEEDLIFKETMNSFGIQQKVEKLGKSN